MKAQCLLMVRQVQGKYTKPFAAAAAAASVFIALSKLIINLIITILSKTHTMEGSLDSPALYGVIPRSAQVSTLMSSAAPAAIHCNTINLITTILRPYSNT